MEINMEMKINMQTEHQAQKNSSKTLTSYVTGFILSLVLTVGAYLLVVNHSPTSVFTPWNIGFIIAALALIQCVIQLVFFIHVRVRTPSRWQFFLLLFMLSVIFILCGSCTA